MSAEFRSLDRDPPTIRFTVNGVPACAPAGTSVAGALLFAGYQTIRQAPADGSPRAPYCMMGACHECLAEVDGTPDCQTCLMVLREGMQISLGGNDSRGPGSA